LLGSRRQRGRDFGSENDILDKDTFNGDTPLVRDISNDFSNFEGYCLTFGNKALNGACTDDVSECGLSSFDKSLTKVSDSKGCSEGVANLEVNDGITTGGKKGNEQVSWL